MDARSPHGGFSRSSDQYVLLNNGDIAEEYQRPDCIFSRLNGHPAYPLSTLRWVPRGSSARLEAKWFATPFLVRLFHPLLHAGLSRRTNIPITLNDSGQNVQTPVIKSYDERTLSPAQFIRALRRTAVQSQQRIEGRRSGSGQLQERDLRSGTEPDGEASYADATVHVELCATIFV